MVNNNVFASLKISNDMNDQLLFIAEQKKSDRSKIQKGYLEKAIAKEMKNYPPELFEEWKAKRELEKK